MSFAAIALALAGLALTAAADPAPAPAPHDPGLSSLRVWRDERLLTVHAAFANADFRGATAIDRDGNGAIDPEELAAARPALERLAAAEFALHGAGGASAPTLVGAAIADNADVELTLAFPLPTAPAALHVTFLRLLSRGHRCYAALLVDGDAIAADALLSPAALEFPLPLATAGAAPSGFAQAGAFFVLGIEHILIGFDHLAFLLALLVGGLSWRRIVATITAFTAAHSITLIGTALGVMQLPSLLVEATIAGSIVFVASANLLQRSTNAHRWPLAFGFGLVHGFGFASVLADLTIGEPRAVAPLLSFNLGVEVGQLAFALAVVPLLRSAARRKHGERIASGLSIAVGLAGLWWLAERLLG